MWFPFKKKIKSKLYDIINNITKNELTNYSQDINNVNNIHTQQIETLYSQVRILSSQFDFLNSKVSNIESRIESLSSQTTEAFSDREKSVWSNLNHNSLCYKNKKVVYTCLSGNYDNLPAHTYVSDDYDYVCFTDNKELLKLKNYGAWQIRNLVFNELDDGRNNRWHKIHPHILFPEYESSIYVDANINIKSNWIFNEVEQKNSDIIIPVHFERFCAYDEIMEVERVNRESSENCKKMRDFLISEQFPKHYGMNENNLIYRKHHIPKIVKIMEEWWIFLLNYSKRDQVSLPYVLWKNGITPQEISIHNLRSLKSDFEFSLHIEPKFHGSSLDTKFIKEFNNIWPVKQIYEGMDESEYPARLCEWYRKVSGGKELNLSSPSTFTDKINYLKLYDKNPLKTILADKYLAPKEVVKICPEIKTIQQLGVWNNATEIDFASLPQSFVLKCNHGSGMNIIVKDKSTIDIAKTCFMLNHWLKVSYEHVNDSFELHYKNINRKIIAEKYIESMDSKGLVDYKIHCINGAPIFIQVIGNRNVQTHTFDSLFYDLNWTKLDYYFTDEGHNECSFDKPSKLAKMIEISKKLSKPFPYVRVDLYTIEEEVYFGEMTFFSRCGYFAWSDENLDKELGKLLDISQIVESKNE